MFQAAQNHVNERISNEDPGEGLSGAGVKAAAPARHVVVKSEEPDSPKLEKKEILTKSGIPTSSIDGEPLLRRRSSSSAKRSPRKATNSSKVVKPQKRSKNQKIDAAVDDTPVRSDRVRKARMPIDHEISPSVEPTQVSAPPSDSPYLKTRVIGTTSAKLSYLISQVLKFYKDEKILIFYDVSGRFQNRCMTTLCILRC